MIDETVRRNVMNRIYTFLFLTFTLSSVFYYLGFISGSAVGTAYSGCGARASQPS
jgi:ABC-type transporter Mla maintaining outer membrane lipid asymmetry permease subunit MlaE